MYLKQIEDLISEAYDKGVVFGASGRNGADNSYKAYLKVKEDIEALAKEQGVNL